MTEMKTYAFGPASGGKPEKIVLMLHGVGSNGQDLIGLAPHLAQALPNVVFVSPDAPQPYDMAPFGFQWFSLQNRDPAAMLRGIEAAMPVLNRYIDGVLEEFGLRDSDLALLGFSQGTMMSLYAGPRRAGKIAGVLGYSGLLPGAE
ncbi:MAG TPA: phospholipase, partial [Micavibrio sp.]